MLTSSTFSAKRLLVAGKSSYGINSFIRRTFANSSRSQSANDKSAARISDTKFDQEQASIDDSFKGKQFDDPFRTKSFNSDSMQSKNRQELMREGAAEYEWEQNHPKQGHKEHIRMPSSAERREEFEEATGHQIGETLSSKKSIRDDTEFIPKQSTKFNEDSDKLFATNWDDSQHQGKGKQGFASMPHEKVEEIAAKGRQAQGKNSVNDSNMKSHSKSMTNEQLQETASKGRNSHGKQSNQQQREYVDEYESEQHSSSNNKGVRQSLEREGEMEYEREQEHPKQGFASMPKEKVQEIAAKGRRAQGKN